MSETSMTTSLRGGYMGRTLQVDLTTGKIVVTPLDAELAFNYVGGRGFTSRLEYDLIPSVVDPLGPENVLIIATGPLTGTSAASASRFTVGARSPLTGILGDSNCGGFWGPELKHAGFDLLLIRGRSSTPVFLWIHDGVAELRKADHLWGRDTRETQAVLHGELGDKDVEVASIGQAGERLVRVAGIVASLDHLAGRTGMGAVMGSKNLKAIAVRGRSRVPVVDPDRARAISLELNEVLKKDPQSGEILPKYGTTVLVDLHNAMGALSTRNWQTGFFEQASHINGDALNSTYLRKVIPCFVCPCKCDRYSEVNEGEYAGTKVGGPEYYTISVFGSRCGNDDLASILKANELCNLYGLDTASVGGLIGFAMECYEKGILTYRDTDGLDLTWGNHSTIVELVKRIAFREGFGNVLAEGLQRAAETIGRGSEYYAIHMKGMDPPTEPRALKVYNFRYAVASRGGDHLRISALGAYELEKYPPAEAAAKLKFWQDVVCIPDLMGLCKFPYIFFSSSSDITFQKTLKLVPEYFTAATGIEMTKEKLLLIAERVATTERAHNARLGLRREHDTLPRRFLEEPLPSGPKKGQVYDILEPMKDAFYRVHGWEVQTGVPTRSTLERLGLSDIASDLMGRGVPVSA